jgi:hypothetical protein
MMAWCAIQIAIREAGGIDSILLASKNHMANVDVQESVCWVMRNLSAAKSNVVSLILIILIINDGSLCQFDIL